MLKRSQTGIPYSADELREIADRIDEIHEELDLPSTLEDDDYRWGLTVSVFREGYIEGLIATHPDGWFGFYPESWRDNDCYHV